MTQVEFFSDGQSHRVVVTDRDLDGYVAHCRKAGATLIRLREYAADRREAVGIAWLAR